MAQLSYLNFDLVIDRLTDGADRSAARYRAHVVSSPGGDGADDFTLPFTARDLRDIETSRASAGQWGADGLPRAAASEDGSAAAAESFGRALFDTVFRDRVRTCLDVSLQIARQKDKGLRIRLRLSEVPELGVLPWECLFRNDFMCLSNGTPIVRYLNLEESVRPLTVSPPLQMLVMAAHPADFDRLDVEREWSWLNQALDPLQRQGLIAVDRLATGSLAALQEELRLHDYHIFHFIGHGGFDAQVGDGVLWLEGEDAMGRPVSAEHIGTLLHDHRSLRLAVLNACEGARGAAHDPFGGTAQTLVRKGLPAVIAMQFPITDRAAIVFAAEFYRAVAADYPVDAALAEARKAMAGESLGPEWATPVLFMRATEGRLFRMRSTSIPRARAAIVRPTAPVPPPDVQGFVGRATELAAFGRQLADEHMVVITGAPGAGQTWLAAKLVRDVAPDTSRIFWHSFGAGQGVDIVIDRLANFMAWHGRDELWRLLEGARTRGEQRPAPELLLDYFHVLGSIQHPVIVLNELQNVDAESRANELVDRLRTMAQRGELTLLITSRRMPRQTALPYRTLGGMSLADTRLLLDARRVQLSDDLCKRLHDATDGHAQLLTLAVERLHQSTNPTDVIDGLAEANDVERFLVHVMDEGLNDAARQVMRAVAIQLGQPASRAAIAAVMDEGRVSRAVLTDLVERYLLTRTESDPPTYDLNAMLQAYYLDDDELDADSRGAMHRRASAYFETAERDGYLAALHAEQAGDAQRAVAFVAANVWAMINQGHAREVATLARRLAPGEMDPLLAARFKLAHGQVAAFLGDVDEARAVYRSALDQLTALSPRADTASVLAQAYRGMGDTYLQTAPQEAADWYRRGLAAVGIGDTGGRAELLVQLGSALLGIGDFKGADEALHDGLALLPEGPSQRRADALMDLGHSTGRRGNLAESTAFLTEAAAVAESLHDSFRLLIARSNLGIVAELSGHWTDAVAEYQRALDVAERLGSAKQRARMLATIGQLEGKQRNVELALAHLTEALAINRRYDLKDFLTYNLVSLAEVFIGSADWPAASACLSEAEVLAEHLEDRVILVYVNDRWSEVLRGQGDAAGALTRSEKALALATELDLAVERGVALRTRAMARLAAGDTVAALDDFAASLAALDGADPYEAARTRRAWGEALADSDPGRAHSLLSESESAMAALGIVRRPVA